LITVNKGTLSFLAEHENWCSTDSSKWVNGSTDWEEAIDLIELLINKLEQVSTGEVVIWNDFTDSDREPCPRFLPRMEEDGDWPMLDLTAERIPYFKAKKMYENGEWDRLVDVEIDLLKADKGVTTPW